MMLAATCYHNPTETAITRLTSYQNRLASHEYKKPIPAPPFERNVAEIVSLAVGAIPLTSRSSKYQMKFFKVASYPPKFLKS